MKYIQTDFQNVISILDKKTQVDNISNFIIFQTEDATVLEKLNTNKYLVNSTKLSSEVNLALEDYLKNNPLEEITEPIYSSYTEIVDEEGNTIKQGSGDIILGIEDIKSNMKVEAKKEMLNDFYITITNDNFSNYFSEKPKTEIEILKEQLLEVQELIVENEYNNLITE